MLLLVVVMQLAMDDEDDVEIDSLETVDMVDRGTMVTPPDI